MSLRKKLQNPYALVGQGFILGGLLFAVTHADVLQASASTEASPASLLPSATSTR